MSCHDLKLLPSEYETSTRGFGLKTEVRKSLIKRKHHGDFGHHSAIRLSRHLRQQTAQCIDPDIALSGKMKIILIETQVLV